MQQVMGFALQLEGEPLDFTHPRTRQPLGIWLWMAQPSCGQEARACTEAAAAPQGLGCCREAEEGGFLRAAKKGGADLCCQIPGALQGSLLGLFPPQETAPISHLLYPSKPLHLPFRSLPCVPALCPMFSQLPYHNIPRAFEP